MRLLDLFCGAGGCTKGYQRAGFYVVGVDNASQPHYIGDEFIQADALDVLARPDRYGLRLSSFDVIHASPPCQHFTKYGNSVKDIRDRYDDFLAPTRARLDEIDLPYVIENVEGAPLLNPVRLCGSTFDGNGTNDLQRHRLFETNWLLMSAGACDHSIWEPNRYPGGRWKARGLTPSSPVRKTVEVGRWNIPLATQKWAMGVDWNMTLRELSESIPPAYTEFIGRQLADWIGGRIKEAA